MGRTKIRKNGVGRKKRSKEKVPFILYITPQLKKKIKQYAVKKDLYLTDVGEALLSRGLHTN